MYDAVELLKRGEQAVVAHSYLGNGKTLFSEAVALLAEQDGYTVYVFDRERPSLAEECDHIGRSSSPTLVIVEDYHRHLDVIKKLRLERNPQVQFLFTCRTPVHLIELPKLRSLFEGYEPAELDLDTLSEAELQELDAAFEIAGLLGGQARLSSPRRVANWRSECGGEFRDVLLALIDAPHIQQRITDIFERLRREPGIQQFAIATLALRHVGQNVDLDVLTELLGVEGLNRARLSQNPEITELLAIDHEHVVTRSPLFPSLALRAYWNSGVVGELLADILERAYALRYDGDIYRSVARELMRFSKIDQIVPKAGHSEKLLGYYERIKNLEGCSRNQFFWLQYAIARIAADDFLPAERFLDTAYALVSKIADFDTYQLDNTKARLLLSRSIYDPEKCNTFADFVAANRIVQGQMRNEGLSYHPFRVAGLYFELWSKIRGRWDATQKEFLKTACTQILTMAGKVDKRLASHADVKRCVETMAATVKAIG